MTVQTKSWKSTKYDGNVLLLNDIDKTLPKKSSRFQPDDLTNFANASKLNYKGQLNS